ncbi:transglycosylase SLT domain-containing protein [Acetobacter conturbans]|uniref:Transglycosylase SLT domain-containing protein n=1 Tax=Acetobacter conturbans TaxID=1737472 RepID=A0ABX0K022_9PROT|nr:transglycosylase SLT domain-containing protein [Acetobacter conturbans]NHN88605.1 transglycosylase SLT domain-containing protein [Acetobacter conturbans]
MTWSSAKAAPTPTLSCEQAATIVERSLDIPAGLLAAIARVESNNHPLAVNVNGVAVPFSRQELAVDAVQTMLKSGAFGPRPHVDVGCFQVNLGWHSTAFASVEDSFDPLSNGLAAGFFLRQLHGAKGNWRDAVARYHAASREGDRYATHVFHKLEGGSGSEPAGVVRAESVSPAAGNGRDWVKTASGYGITVFEPVAKP